MIGYNTEVTDTLRPMLQVVFVLRKKERQISFLHVYHHASQVLYTWAHLKYLPGSSQYTVVVRVPSAIETAIPFEVPVTVAAGSKA
jgi:hypothetical protein